MAEVVRLQMIFKLDLEAEEEAAMVVPKVSPKCDPLSDQFRSSALVRNKWDLQLNLMISDIKCTHGGDTVIENLKN